VACLYFNSDGTVDNTRVMQESGVPELDAAAEQALAAVKRDREKVPEPIPPHLRFMATSEWNCFLIGRPRSL
jgi:outer membrane biosynthesis protein TonB